MNDVVLMKPFILSLTFLPRLPVFRQSFDSDAMLPYLVKDRHATWHLVF